MKKEFWISLGVVLVLNVFLIAGIMKVGVEGGVTGAATSLKEEMENKTIVEIDVKLIVEENNVTVVTGNFSERVE